MPAAEAPQPAACGAGDHSEEADNEAGDLWYFAYGSMVNAERYEGRLCKGMSVSRARARAKLRVSPD